MVTFDSNELIFSVQFQAKQYFQSSQHTRTHAYKPSKGEDRKIEMLVKYTFKLRMILPLNFHHKMIQKMRLQLVDELIYRLMSPSSSKDFHQILCLNDNRKFINLRSCYYD